MRRLEDADHRHTTSLTMLHPSDFCALQLKGYSSMVRGGGMHRLVERNWDERSEGWAM